MTGMNATRFAKCGLAAAAAMATAGAASAAAISWGAPGLFNDASDVVNNGNVVTAMSSSAQTVNGVSFASGNLGDYVSGGQYGVGTFMTATGNADFDQLANSHQYGPAGMTTFTITLSGLSVGQAYNFQAFIVDFRDCCSGRLSNLGDNDGGTPSVDFARSFDGTAGTTITGTFVADATTQEITHNASTSDHALSGWVLSQVPEPGSLALLGLGGLMLARRRRG